MVYIMKNGEFSVIFLNKLYNVECLFLFLCLVFIHFFVYLFFYRIWPNLVRCDTKQKLSWRDSFTSSVQLKIT